MKVKVILLLVILIAGVGIVAKFTILKPDSSIKNLGDIKRIKHGLAAKGICARYGDSSGLGTWSAG